MGYDENEKQKIAGAVKETVGEVLEADEMAEIGEEEQREAQEAEEAERSDPER